METFNIGWYIESEVHNYIIPEFEKILNGLEYKLTNFKVSKMDTVFGTSALNFENIILLEIVGSNFKPKVSNLSYYIIKSCGTENRIDLSVYSIRELVDEFEKLHDLIIVMMTDADIFDITSNKQSIMEDLLRKVRECYNLLLKYKNDPLSIYKNESKSNDE